MTIGDMASSKYHLRHPNTSTLMAVARGAYEELDMASPASRPSLHPAHRQTLPFAPNGAQLRRI
jgi:hypothetical protein